MKDHVHTNDAILLEGIQNGDNKAFETLYYKYCDQLYYFSYKYLRSSDEAHSLVQDTFAKIWEVRHTIEASPSLSSFIFTIAKHNIFNKHRKKINENLYKEHLRKHLDEVYDKTENDIILNDLKQKIDQQVEKLPPKRREIYLLIREQGLTYKEIAERLDISEKTIESHMRLALKTLREIFRQELLLPLWWTLWFGTQLA